MKKNPRKVFYHFSLFFFERLILGDIKGFQYRVYQLSNRVRTLLTIYEVKPVKGCINEIDSFDFVVEGNHKDGEIHGGILGKYLISGEWIDIKVILEFLLDISQIEKNGDEPIVSLLFLILSDYGLNQSQQVRVLRLPIELV